MNTPVVRALLYLDGVNVTFDGFRALRSLSLTVETGAMRAIIGPNGAGKTTMMDVITGKTKPDNGDVLFADGTVDLTRHDEASIAELGIGRKFQKPTVFESHTVADNVLLATSGPRGAFSSLWGARARVERERIDEALETVRLLGHRERRAGELSHGQKQWLEIAML
ncbi:MAG: ATP-binding cassette domain-containing protein, partial [Alphaproteobacteria bacterium]|nr:ATP-binding cassette domain-containing protein [Alphaproteobacteria bacterium]